MRPHCPICGATMYPAPPIKTPENKAQEIIRRVQCQYCLYWRDITNTMYDTHENSWENFAHGRGGENG